MLKLDALNITLDAIGVYPVTQWDSPHPDAVRARQTVTRFNTEIQGRGWWCNREYNFELTPDNVSNKIIMPAGTLIMDPTDERSRYIKRGKYLYDPVAHSYTFTGPVRVHLIMELDYDDLPNSLQTYIARSAAVEFAVVREGDQNKITKLEQAMYQARSQAFSDELKTSNYNVFNSGLPQRVLAGIRPAVRGY